MQVHSEDAGLGWGQHKAEVWLWPDTTPDISTVSELRKASFTLPPFLRFCFVWCGISTYSCMCMCTHVYRHTCAHEHKRWILGVILNCIIASFFFFFRDSISP